jgi:hypothetical protein
MNSACRLAFRAAFSRQHLFAWLVAAAFLCVLRPSIRGNDGVQNYAPLRSLLFDRDLDYTNEYAHYFARDAAWFDNKHIPRDPVTGRPVNLYGIGNAVLWAPWVLLFHGAGIVAQGMGVPVTLDGYSALYEAAVGIGSAFYASLGLLLLHRALRRRFGDDPAFWAMLVAWLASPLFFYMHLHPSMSHANSFFLAALLLLLYLGGDGVRRWAAMGAVAGLMTLVRFQDLLIVAALVPAELLRRDRGSPGARLKRYAAFCAAAIAVFSPQLLAWDYLQGSPFSGPRAYMTQGTVKPWAPVHVLEVLFSPRHGLFYWTPALMIGLAGLLAPRGDVRLKLLCLAAFAAQLWIISSWSIWWAGASFGHRMFISTLPALAVGAASLLSGYPRAGRVLKPLVLVLILWNFGCMAQYALGIIPRQEGVSYAVLARNNFVTLPRMAVLRFMR